PNDIFLMNADGTNVRQLTFGSSAVSVVWSPDGTKLAFFSKRDGPPHNFTVAVDDGSAIQRIFHAYDQDWGLKWSPDGHKVAFIAIQGDTTSIYLANNDGTNAQSIAELNPSGIIGSLSWSPSGQQLAFSTFSPMIMTPEPHSLNDGQICILTIITRNI